MAAADRGGDRGAAGSGKAEPAVRACRSRLNLFAARRSTLRAVTFRKGLGAERISPSDCASRPPAPAGPAVRLLRCGSYPLCRPLLHASRCHVPHRAGRKQLKPSDSAKPALGPLAPPQILRRSRLDLFAARRSTLLFRQYPQKICFFLLKKTKKAAIIEEVSLPPMGYAVRRDTGCPTGFFKASCSK